MAQVRDIIDDALATDMHVVHTPVVTTQGNTLGFTAFA